MWYRFAVIFAFVGCQLINASHIVQKQGPCNFYDTVNITSGHLDQHGNFHHKGMVYKKGTFQEYDHIVENYTRMVRVEPHVRGCICSYKTCIRLCTEPCFGNDNTNSSCVKTKSLLVPTQEGDEEEIDLNGKRYGVLTGRPCEKMYKLEPTEYDYDKWFFAVSKIDLIGIFKHSTHYLTPSSL